MPMWLIMTLILWAIAGICMLIVTIFHDGGGFVEDYRYSVDNMGKWRVSAFVTSFIALPLVMVVVVPPMAILTMISDMWKSWF